MGLLGNDSGDRPGQSDTGAWDGQAARRYLGHCTASRTDAGTVLLPVDYCQGWAGLVQVVSWEGGLGRALSSWPYSLEWCRNATSSTGRGMESRLHKAMVGTRDRREGLCSVWARSVV